MTFKRKILYFKAFLNMVFGCMLMLEIIESP
ncbi:hypothetical protein HPELS_03500 [Helicobacter pylori ELS37]|uniref:Lipoprotein n=1 Tax=Helicobacter pylori ELS37 TaxID=1055527 RepID=A0ABC7ZFM4_HELPX|nr:hypothetical protein HPELS_03500 [Helicobacter pylori ELS37]